MLTQDLSVGRRPAWSPALEDELLACQFMGHTLDMVSESGDTSQLLEDFRPWVWQQVIQYAIANFRYVAIAASRRSGKTTVVAHELVKIARKFDWSRFPDRMRKECPPRYFVVVPFIKQGQRTLWRLVQEQVESIGGKVREEHAIVPCLDNETYADIYLVGSQVPAGLRGDHLDGVVYEETAFQNPAVREVIAPTLQTFGGWSWDISSVNGYNDFKDIIDDYAEQDNCCSLVIPWSSIRHLPEEEIETYRRRYGEEAFQREFECNFNAPVEGSYWGDEIARIRAEGRNGCVPFQPDHKVFVTTDIGVGDETSLWWFQVIGGMVHWCAHRSFSGRTLQYMVKLLKEESARHDPPLTYAQVFFPHDIRVREWTHDDGDGYAKSREEKAAELLKGIGAQLRRVRKCSIEDRISTARNVLSYSRFNTNDPEVQKGLNALAMYQKEYDHERKVFKQKPLHNWASNPADSLGYGSLMINTHKVAMEAMKLTQERKIDVEDPLKEAFQRARNLFGSHTDGMDLGGTL